MRERERERGGGERQKGEEEKKERKKKKKKKEREKKPKTINLFYVTKKKISLFGCSSTPNSLNPILILLSVHPTSIRN